MSSGKLTPEQLIELTQMALPKEIFEVSNRIHYSKWQTAERRITALKAELAAEDKRRQALESRIDELIQQFAAANERAAALAAAIQPFAEFGNRMTADDDYTYMSDRVQDWLGVSDFKNALTAYACAAPILADLRRAAKREALTLQREWITGVKMPDSYHHGLQALAFHRGIHAALDVLVAALAALDAEEKGEQNAEN